MTSHQSITRIIVHLHGPIVWIFLLFTSSVIAADFKPNWLSVSDPQELKRSWESALVHLPEKTDSERGFLLGNTNALNTRIVRKFKQRKLPLILYLHDCEGLGHHRDDIERLALLGFVVIAPDSFAREHRPLGCYEEKSRYIKYYDIAIAFRKAELDYAVNHIARLPWVDTRFLYLIGSGMGGMVAAHYQGAEFRGHVIEGWGCRHPHTVFDGIWAPPQVKILTVNSKNDLWYKDVPGFETDCVSFLADRVDSKDVVLDRAAHYVSWLPEARSSLINFLTQDMDVDQAALLDDTPRIVKSGEGFITLEVRWSVESVYEQAEQFCAKSAKQNHLISNEIPGVYSFVCS